MSSNVNKNRINHFVFLFAAHALTLNEIAFDVALKLQTEHEERRLMIHYLDDNNPIEFVHDKQFKEHVLQDTYSVHLASTVRQKLFLYGHPIEFDVLER